MPAKRWNSVPGHGAKEEEGGLKGGRGGGGAQRTQYPLIKEYTLNHNIKAPIIEGIFLN